jgi:Tol biopolymer transport system component
MSPRARSVLAGALAAAAALGAGSAVASAATTERVSVDSAEGQSDVFVQPPGTTPGAFGASISADGLAVAFESTATDLVPGDTNGERDIFVRDRGTGTTELVSVGAGGAPANGLSGGADISGDGRFVAFLSEASNLVAGDDNGRFDAFVRNRAAGTTELVSLAPDGRRLSVDSIELSISDDGRFVAWRAGVTGAPDPVFVRDRRQGTTVLASVAPPGVPLSDAFGPAISGDGRFVAFNAFTGQGTESNLLLRSLATASTEVLGRNLGEGSLSRDGRFVAFTEGQNVDEVTVVVLDRSTGARQRIAPGIQPELSADGRFVAFTEPASTVVAGPGPQDVMVHDRVTGLTEVASLTAAGAPADESSGAPVISADGRSVAFESHAANLVPGDTNGVQDIFVRDRAAGATPAELLAALRAHITGFGLDNGTERSLTAKVDAASAALRRGGRTAACGSLGALENHVRAQAAKHLTAVQAMQVVAGARAIRDALGCR